MTLTAEITDEGLAELVGLIEQVKAGNEVLLAVDQKVIAKLILIDSAEPSTQPDEPKK